MIFILLPHLLSTLYAKHLFFGLTNCTVHIHMFMYYITLSGLQVQYQCRASLSANELLAEGAAFAHSIGRCSVHHMIVEMLLAENYITKN